MEIHQLLREAVTILAAATAVVLLSSRLRIPSIAGFLLTGVLIGPSGLRLVSRPDQVEVFAEIGVIFLLFSIGLEFSLDRLKQIRRFFFLGGSLQTLLTIALIALLAVAAGLTPRRAVFLGFLAALSSTAIVLKLYADRRELDAPQGKILIAILLFQDFLIVPMIVLTPVLAGSVDASGPEIAMRFLLALAGIGLVFAVARHLMPRLLRLLVRTRLREVLVLGALTACLGMAWLTESFEFSLALGAFLAGIIISESEYSHQVMAEVIPFRDVFNSLFFIAIGMLLEVPYALAHPGAVLGLASAVLGIKAAVAAAAVLLLRFPLRTAVIAGVGLAQVGEFSFVLLKVGQAEGLLDRGFYQTFIAASILTMLVTPGLVSLAPRIGARFARFQPSQEETLEAGRPLRDHVVVVGFGVNGRTLAKVLRPAGVRYTVLELDGEIVRRAREDGEPILFGDITRPEILEHARVGEARMIVFAISDVEAVRRGIRFARELNPDLYILVRTRHLHEIDELRRLGADDVIAEEFETAIEIFTRVLERYHVPRNVIRAQTLALRGESYLILRAPSLDGRLSQALLDVLAEGTTDIFRLDSGSPWAGQTIRDLNLRRRAGATIIAVVRGERSFTNPGPDMRLEAGDSLVLVGSHREMEQAFELLDRRREPGA